MRGLEAEFGESTNAIRLELNRLEEAGMLISDADGNKKRYRANVSYPLYGEIHSILRKYIGLDTIISAVIENLGHVEKVYLTGNFAQGLDGPMIDLLIIGDVDKAYLVKLIDKVEPLIHRRIRYVVFSADEFDANREEFSGEKAFLVWEA